MKKVFMLYLIIWGFLVNTNAQTILKNDTNLSAKLDTFFNNYYKPDEPGCAVLIQQGDDVLYKKAFGMADLEYELPMKPDMVFDLGSIGKQITAVVIMQLVEQGKLALDDPLDKYIKDFPMQAYTITIEHLLTHTSGLTDIFQLEAFGPDIWRLDHTKENYLGFLKKATVDFAPGSKYSYCNTGYILLGYIIEEITGITRQQYIEDNIFKKFGMTNSYYSSYHRIIKNRASGYGKNEVTGEFENLERVSSTVTDGAGTLMFNTEDFIRYYKALNSYQIISKESLERTRAKYILSDGKESRYGYGVFTGELNGHYFVTHTGGITGYFTSQIYFPNEAIHALIFTNCDTYVSNDPTSKVGKLIFEE
jgi:CubicO group peptidase (beta-lactamase class C family)